MTTREKALAALRAAWEGVDCGAKTPLVCPPPTDVPSHPRVPTLGEAETTLLAAMKGVECDADAVLAAATFLEQVAIGASEREVRPEHLHISDERLPVCEDTHLPDEHVATTPEEAEAQARAADADTADACDASRGGTLALCRGSLADCVEIGEYTGPPKPN